MQVGGRAIRLYRYLMVAKDRRAVGLCGGSHYLSFLLLATTSKVRIVRTIMSIS